jgi:predicted ABC-type ATPase
MTDQLLSLENALKAVEADVSDDPRNITLCIERARILARLNRAEAAKNAYIDVIAVDPTNFDALNELGSLLYASGYQTAARTAWAEAVAHHPEKSIPSFVPARPDVFMVGGESGAGKTTLGLMLLPMSLGVANYVSADAIASGLNPVRPETAQPFADRMMFQYLRNLIFNKKTFGFESTCASTEHRQTLLRCRDAGYFVTLIYLWLPSVEIAVARIKIRTSQVQIHQRNDAILEDTIRRRYAIGIANMLNLYLPMADAAFILDASDMFLDATKIIAEKLPGQALKVHNPACWHHIQTTSAGVNAS